MIFVVVNNLKVLLSKWLKENFFDIAQLCKHWHRSAMCNSAWCDVNKTCSLLNFLDMCHNPKWNCQKQISFTPKRFHLERSGFKHTIKEIFKGTEKVWNQSIKPGLKKTTPNISAGVAAKTKKPQSAQTTSNISKSLTGGKKSSLTDMHGLGLRLNVLSSFQI